MRVIAPPGAVSILAIAAHPDDIESWCAGTLAVALDRGATARLLLVTSGDAGSSDPAATRESVAALREAEARVAADRLGLADVALLRYPDGEVENTRDLVAAIWSPRSGGGSRMQSLRMIRNARCRPM